MTTGTKHLTPKPTDIASLQEKFFNLVWLARHRALRKGYQPDILAEADAAAERVEAAYPEDAEKVDDWTHGFNSGVLAALRLVSAIQGGETWGNAYADFPMLDT